MIGWHGDSDGATHRTVTEHCSETCPGFKPMPMGYWCEGSNIVLY